MCVDVFKVSLLFPEIPYYCFLCVHGYLLLQVIYYVKGDTCCSGQHVCFTSKGLPPMLKSGFESQLRLEFLGFSMCHFVKLVVGGFSPGTLVSSHAASINGFSQ